MNKRVSNVSVFNCILTEHIVSDILIQRAQVVSVLRQVVEVPG